MLADINGNLADLRSESAMASQRFCLRWNNHQSNLLSVFDQLLADESFVDVTLACEGHLFKAHKMVLSACSPYFQALFKNHPDKHPIVILKDVPMVDMRSLLDFMYRGEVSVDQERLTGFLRVAESLRIKGLTEVNEEKSDPPSITSSVVPNQASAPPPPPNLHRINQHQHHNTIPKKYQHQPLHPYLTTAPKRKRGRPRKLSGSSDTPVEANLSNLEKQCADLVQGSPELLEMKMGLDFQSEVAQNSSAGSSSAGSNASHKQNSAAAKKDEPTENGTETADANLLARIKGEPEPTPGTSTQDFAQSSCSSNSSVKSEGSEKSRGMSIPEKSTPPPDLHDQSSSPPPARASSNPSPAASNANNSTSSQSSTTTTTTTVVSPSSTPVRSANAMGAPTTRQAPKRRMRRKVSSHAQDPAEQLTEMSVRGLNLFRYATISDGLFQCLECAKQDVAKTFKNKYSFQRHAFLYHEGDQRKVFPCHVCNKEFSRPDKMKNHMKTVHEYPLPKDINALPFQYFMPQ